MFEVRRPPDHLAIAAVRHTVQGEAREPFGLRGEPITDNKETNNSDINIIMINTDARVRESERGDPCRTDLWRSAICCRVLFTSLRA